MHLYRYARWRLAGLPHPRRIGRRAALSNAVRILQCNIAGARSAPADARAASAIRAEALLAAQHLHDLEDARRGERAGQRGAQRLRDRAELQPAALGKPAQSRLRVPAPSIPSRRAAPAPRRARRAAAGPRRVSSLGGVGGERDRPRRDIEAGLLRPARRSSWRAASGRASPSAGARGRSPTSARPNSFSSRSATRPTSRSSSAARI